MELLTTREYFRKKLGEIDHEFIAFIQSESASEVIKEKLQKEWVKQITENNIKIDFVWQKIVKGKKHSKEMKLRKIVVLFAITLIIVQEQKKDMLQIQ